MSSDKVFFKKNLSNLYLVLQFLVRIAMVREARVLQFTKQIEKKTTLYKSLHKMIYSYFNYYATVLIPPLYTLP